jgi:eight-cysteine-cluster-containing protein
MRYLLILTAIMGLMGCMASRDDALAREKDACHIGGCSGQVCSDRDDIATTCEWRDAYECYQSARCEQQRDGTCGWTPTAELDACLAGHAPKP